MFRLIVGLGNPTPQYEKTRHNAGFWFLDRIALAGSLSFRNENRFHGEVAKLEVAAGQTAFLFKPMTFMNRCGLAVAAIAKFYRISPPEILVVHDELDFNPGVARLKVGGGHGGHNGLRDIVAHVGADFARLRIGIGHPGHRDAVSGYVLSPPRDHELAEINDALGRAGKVMPQILSGQFEMAANSLNRRADLSSSKSGA